MIPEDIGIYRIIIKDVACFIQCKNLRSNFNAPAVRIISNDEAILYPFASKSFKAARGSERGDTLALLYIDIILLLIIELIPAFLICTQPLQSHSHVFLNFDITQTFHLPEGHLNYVLNVCPMQHLREPRTLTAS